MTKLIFSLLIFPVLIFSQESADPFASVKSNEVAPPNFVDGPNASVSLMMYEISTEDLTKLLFEENLLADQSRLYEKVASMRSDNRTSLRDIFFLSGPTGEELKYESIYEFIYPTEFEPESVPDQILIDKNVTLSKDLAAALGSLITPATPTAFEPRNLGTTISANVSLGNTPNDPTIFRFSYEKDSHTGWSSFLKDEVDTTSRSKIQMPVFTVDRFSTQIRIKTDAVFLINTITARNKDGEEDNSKKILFFGKVSIAK